MYALYCTCAPYSTHARASLHVRHMAYMQDYTSVIKREGGVVTKESEEELYNINQEIRLRRELELYYKRYHNTG